MRLKNMPGTLTRIKYIYSIWLAIKWLTIVTIVSRSGGCGGDYSGAVHKSPLSEGFITITIPFVNGKTSTDRADSITQDAQVRTT